MEGLAVTTQFSKDETGDNESMDIEKLGGRETRKCYNCNTIGHISKDCRKRKDKTDKTDKKNIICNYCKIKGHYERECFRKKKDKGEKTGDKFKRKGGLKTTKEEDEEDNDSQSALELQALEYEDAEDISRIRGRARGLERFRRTRADFPGSSGQGGH